MKKRIAYAAILVLLLYGFSTRGLSQNKPSAYYNYQLALEFGIGKVSAPGTRFPFCTYYGGFIRYKKHSLGARYSYHSLFEIFKKPDHYSNTYAFYGWGWNFNNTQVIFQGGIGWADNFIGEKYYSGMAYEVSTDLIVHGRGNGAGIRLLMHYSPEAMFAGFMFHSMTGWSWNIKAYK